MPKAQQIPMYPVGSSNRHISRLIQALASKQLTQDEYRQYRDLYLGLLSLNGHTNNLIASRLWDGLCLPLGLILCTDGRWRHIATIAKNGKRRPQ